VRDDYARYEFHLVVQRLQTFCSEDLGGFYLDVLKDRLYTAGKTSRARRSAQTALASIRDALLELMAPVPVVHRRGGVAHRASGRRVDLLPHLGRNAARAARRGCARREVGPHPRRSRRGAEGARDAAPERERSGSSLQAEVSITAAARRLRRAREPRRRLALRDDHVRPQPVARGDALAITAAPSAHAKCERCWHYRADVGSDPAHPTLCARCVSNLFGAGEPRVFA
jgi:isoleucyl-tRNA synthetase